MSRITARVLTVAAVLALVAGAMAQGRTKEPAYKAGTSLMSTRPGTASGAPEVVRGVDDLTKPVGTRSAWVPRAYLMAPDMSNRSASLLLLQICPIFSVVAPCGSGASAPSVPQLFRGRYTSVRL